jgi:hypothetical protein
MQKEVPNRAGRHSYPRHWEQSGQSQNNPQDPRRAAMEHREGGPDGDDVGKEPPRPLLSAMEHREGGPTGDGVGKERRRSAVVFGMFHIQIRELQL